MIFKIEITETLQKTVEIEADNEGDAFRIAKERYFKEVYVLDETNYIDTEMDLIEDD